MTVALHRGVKSFVRREGRATPRQRQAFIQWWPKYGVSLSDPVAFNDAIVEIGFGMGDSLLRMAAENPDETFVGIEVHRPGVGGLLAGLHEVGLNNVKVFCEDAVLVMTRAVPDQILQKVQIFFPDPWPKKRHHKRRLIQPPFLDVIASKLKTGGQIHLATDWEDYAHQMLTVCSRHAALLNTSSGFMTHPTARPITKFEQRGRKMGHHIWELLFIKK